MNEEKIKNIKIVIYLLLAAAPLFWALFIASRGCVSEGELDSIWVGLLSAPFALAAFNAQGLTKEEIRNRGWLIFAVLTIILVIIQIYHCFVVAILLN